MMKMISDTMASYSSSILFTNKQHSFIVHTIEAHLRQSINSVSRQKYFGRLA